MSVTEIEYEVVIESGGWGVRVDWGNEKGWIKKYEELLERVDKITLFPRKNVQLPIVSVSLSEGKDWILFSRVAGEATSGRRIRMYAIGWKENVNGKSIKSITWIYPNGLIENAENPSFVKKFF